MTLGLNTRSGKERRQQAATEQTAEMYFPLRTGNEWTYSFMSNDGEKRQIVRVEGMQQMRDHEWAILSYRVEGSQEEFRKLLRTEGDMLIQYSVPRTEEIHLIDFGRTEVDRTDPSLGFVEEQDRKVTLRGMTFERCVVVGSGFVDHEVGVYAPGIGLIESSWLYGRKQLVHACVDGVELEL